MKFFFQTTAKENRNLICRSFGRADPRSYRALAPRNSNRGFLGTACASARQSFARTILRTRTVSSPRRRIIWFVFSRITSMEAQSMLRLLNLPALLALWKCSYYFRERFASDSVLIGVWVLLAVREKFWILLRDDCRNMFPYSAQCVVRQWVHVFASVHGGLEDLAFFYVTVNPLPEVQCRFGLLCLRSLVFFQRSS